MDVRHLTEIRARVVERPWGTVVLTRPGFNTDRLRLALAPWFDTAAGRVWRADHTLRAAS